MKPFHFTKTYFRKSIFNDEKTGIRVVVKERPSLEITEEDYSLRIETRHYEDRGIHRDCAIEHHLDQKHSIPHLQFKLHSEEIGTFRINLNFKNEKEYENAILGFVYKIKDILGALEKHKTGIIKEILVLELVNKLSKQGVFLSKKISESLEQELIEFDDIKKLPLIKNNPLLKSFMGERNIHLITHHKN